MCATLMEPHVCVIGRRVQWAEEFGKRKAVNYQMCVIAVKISQIST